MTVQGKQRKAILFAAYGVTFESRNPAAGVTDFRFVVACSGVAVAVMVFAGVVSVVSSKHLSWTEYRDFFDRSGTPDPPRPFEDRTLEWGVNTKNTWRTLLPDALLPPLFVVAWCALLF